MTLLNIDTAGAVQLDLESLIGESIAILGIKGSGKTNTSAVILEELLANALPLSVVDIEGEYWGLKEAYSIIVIGRSANVDIEVDATTAAEFARYSVTHGISMILDLSGFKTEEMHEFLLAYFEALWEVEFETRRPYQVILEEAHEFIPQGARTPIKELFTRLALRGRKRGIGMVIISQRSAKVDKSTLTQAGIVILHRVVHPIDVKIYQEILPLPARIVEERVGTLTKGDALVLIDHKVTTARIRRRHTYHAGATPELDASQRTHLPRADDSMLAELRRLVTAPAADATAKDGKDAGEVEKLRSKLSEREGMITARNAEIARLKQQIETQGGELERWKKAAQAKPAPVPVSVPATNHAEPMPAKRPALQPEPSASRGTIDRSEATKQREQRRWNALLLDLKRYPLHKREILIFLLEREGTKYSIKQMARALKYTESTILKNPPTDLIRDGLLKRSGLPGDFLYYSTVREKLAEMFGNLDTGVLIAELIRKIKP